MSKLRETATIEGAHAGLLNRAITALEKIAAEDDNPRCRGCHPRANLTEAELKKLWEDDGSYDCECHVLFARDALEMKDGGKDD